jgi:hypothetical protein
MRRRCTYKEFDTAQVGHCLLITGGMVSAPDAVIEREDGTMTRVPIELVQFTDIKPWTNIDPIKEDETNE